MQRNNAYDIAKSWAIFSVLTYHVINIIYYNQPIHSFIDTYFLTLFFTISGLLTKRDKVCQAGWLKKQTVHLLLPFITVFILYRLYLFCIKGSAIISSQALNDSKSGFWFIFTLYCFFLTIKLIELFTSRIRNRLIVCTLLLLPFITSVISCSVLSYEVAGYFSLMSFRRYWLFFLYGYIITNAFDYLKLMSNNFVRYSSYILYPILTLIYVVKVQDVGTNLDFAIWFAANFVGCHFWLLLFEKAKYHLSNGIVLSIGQNTLGIYLLHYFPLSIVSLAIGGGNMLNDSVLNWIMALAAVLVILLFSWLLTWLVKLNKITALLFLGIIIKTK